MSSEAKKALCVIHVSDEFWEDAPEWAYEQAAHAFDQMGAVVPSTLAFQNYISAFDAQVSYPELFGNFGLVVFKAWVVPADG